MKLRVPLYINGDYFITIEFTDSIPLPYRVSQSLRFANGYMTTMKFDVMLKNMRVVGVATNSHFVMNKQTGYVEIVEPAEGE